jgi:hypothetical protein
MSGGSLKQEDSQAVLNELFDIDLASSRKWRPSCALLGKDDTRGDLMHFRLPGGGSSLCACSQGRRSDRELLGSGLKIAESHDG